LDEIDPVQLGTSAAQSTPSIPLASAHPSQLATNGSFRSSYNRKDILQMKSSSTLVNTSKIFDQKLEKNVIQSQVSGLNKVSVENKDFEVLDASNVFAKLEMFSEDILLSAQYSPASSRNRSSPASDMRTSNTSRMSNNSTRPSSRAQDVILKIPHSNSGADPLPLSRSYSGEGMLTSYHYLSNVSDSQSMGLLY
jgi:hypothetical protein